MSIYGITRLLASRDLGPAQIVPTLDAFASEVEERCGCIATLHTALDAIVVDRPELESALAALRPEVERVRSEIVTTFSSGHKLGARNRLALEAVAPRLGAELQAVQQLTELILAAAEPQPAPLRLYDLVSGVWRPRPTFVSRRVEVVLAGSSPGFEGEPRVLRAMLVAALRAVEIEQPCLSVRGHPPGISVGAGDPAELATIERGWVLLPPALLVEPDVLAAVGRHLGISLRLDGGDVCIDLAA